MRWAGDGASYGVLLDGYHYERTLAGDRIVSIEPIKERGDSYLVTYNWEELGAPQYRRLLVAIRRAPDSKEGMGTKKAVN